MILVREKQIKVNQGKDHPKSLMRSQVHLVIHRILTILTTTYTLQNRNLCTSPRALVVLAVLFSELILELFREHFYI
jgi:hypothetical protein